MNQISITITAGDWPELTAKVCTFAAALTAMPPVQPQPQQPVYPSSAAPPTQAPVAPAAAPVQAPTAAPAAMPAPVQAAPTVAPTYTLQQLALAATPLIDAGRQAELQALLAQFEVQAVTFLKPEQYGAFATALRGLGVKI